jgi:hypothetical protein
MIDLVLSTERSVMCDFFTTKKLVAQLESRELLDARKPYDNQPSKTLTNRVCRSRDHSELTEKTTFLLRLGLISAEAAIFHSTKTQRLRDFVAGNTALPAENIAIQPKLDIK